MIVSDDPASPVRVARHAFHYACVFAVAFALFRVQEIATTYISEYPTHVQIARELIAPNPFGFAVPHPGFHWLTLALGKLAHIRLEDAGVLVLASFVVAIAVVNNQALRKAHQGLCSEREILWQGVAMLLVSAVFFPPVSQNFYLGQGTANFWATPTLVVVRPFAVASVLLLVALFDKANKSARPRTALWLSVCLLLSVVMKPSFLIVFAPVAAVYAACKWRQIDRRLFLLGVLACLPCVLLLVYQYYTSFRVTPDSAQSALYHDSVQLTWFGVWRGFSSNILGSILLGVAFPLALSLCRLRSLLRNDYLLISWGIWFVGFLQFAFVAETQRFAHGNFSWGYNLALSLLFVFCTAEWVRWVKETPAVRGLQKVALGGVSALFALHLVSGVVYLLWQLQGKIYY